MTLNHHFKDRWIEAGLEKTAGSASVCEPAPAKSSRVYYLTTIEYAVSNIALSRLKIGRFSQLNDPFELYAPLWSQKLSSREWRAYREQFDLKNGVLCFSSDWRNPVLWSHYGGRHQGICLGFNVKDNILYDVEYQTERLDIELVSKKITKPTIEKIFSTKFSSWKYENERRVMVPLTRARKEGPLYFQKFDDELQLAEVILGPLCGTSIDSIRSLVGRLYENVVTFQARLASDSFYVVPDESSVPYISPSKT